MPTQDSQQILRAKHGRHTTFLVKLFPARFADPTSKDQAVPALAHIRVSPNFGRYRLWADLLRGGDIHLFQLAIGGVTPDSNPDIFAVHKQYGFRFSIGMLADYLCLAVCGQPVQRHAKDSRDFHRGGHPLCRKLIYVSPNFLLVAACVAGDNDPPGHEAYIPPSQLQFEFDHCPFPYHRGRPRVSRISFISFPILSASTCAARFSKIRKSSRSSRRIWRSRRSPRSNRTLARPLSSSRRSSHLRSCSWSLSNSSINKWLSAARAGRRKKRVPSWARKWGRSFGEKKPRAPLSSRRGNSF